MENNENNNDNQINELVLDLDNPDLTNDQKQNTMNAIIQLQPHLNDEQKARCIELFNILKDIELLRYNVMNRDALDMMFALLSYIEDGVIYFDEDYMRELENQNRLFPPNIPDNIIPNNVNGLLQNAENYDMTLNQAYINELLRLEIAKSTHERNNLINNNNQNINMINNNNQVGGRRKTNKSRKTKKSRKTNKSRKSKNSKKSRKYRR